MKLANVLKIALVASSSLLVLETSFAGPGEIGSGSLEACPVVNGHFVMPMDLVNNQPVVDIRTDNVSKSHLLYSFDGGDSFRIVDSVAHPFFQNGQKAGETSISCSKNKISMKVQGANGQNLSVDYSILSSKKISVSVGGTLADDSGIAPGTYKLQE